MSRNIAIFACLIFCLSYAIPPQPKKTTAHFSNNRFKEKSTAFMAGNLSYYVGGFHASWKSDRRRDHRTNAPFSS